MQVKLQVPNAIFEMIENFKAHLSHTNTFSPFAAFAEFFPDSPIFKIIGFVARAASSDPFFSSKNHPLEARIRIRERMRLVEVYVERK